MNEHLHGALLFAPHVSLPFPRAAHAAIMRVASLTASPIISSLHAVASHQNIVMADVQH
jgi:hypothetical protein